MKRKAEKGLPFLIVDRSPLRSLPYAAECAVLKNQQQWRTRNRLSQLMQNAHHSAQLSEISLSGGLEIHSAQPPWLGREIVTSIQ
jgi:hypothetical protein